MSWGFHVAGTGSDAGAQLKRQIDDSMKYSQGERHDRVLSALRDLANVLTGEYPDHIVTFETNGHLDTNYGNASLAFKVFPKPPALTEPGD